MRGSRTILLWFAFLLPLAAADTQVICSLGADTSAYKPGEDQRPTGDAMELATRVDAAVKTICGTNCPMAAVFRNATAPNLMLMANAGIAKMVYAPQFFNAVYDQFGDGGIVGLVAHVMGHALDDTLGAAWIKSNWTPELRADAWAGCALARARLQPDDLEDAARALAKYPSRNHPAWNLRLPVLRTGFSECGGVGAKFGLEGK